MVNSFTISGQLIDLHDRRMHAAEIIVKDGIITSIREVATAPEQYILPGFVDAHIHIESSMLVPTAFAQVAVVHGTVATVSDPHEIANVNGRDGVDYMITNSKLTPFKFFFGAPSCVPATSFETAGYTLDAKAVEDLLHSEDIWYLSEMMNYPDVLHGDAEVMAKIAAAKKVGKPIDGHAPGLKGDLAAQYSAAGMSTDHECYTLEEALDKIKAGMHILIREGSAAKNYEALADLLRLHPGKVMFCSDDKHPDELLLSHINAIVKRSLAKGYDLYDVLRAACVHPVAHYKLPVGLLRAGDAADFIVVDNLSNFNVLQTYINGQLVAAEGKTLLPDVPVNAINNFRATKRSVADFEVRAAAQEPIIKVIEAVEGQLITRLQQMPAKVQNGAIVSDTANDVLKLVVINRYEEHAPVAVAFIKSFGLRHGALASTVAHDCHNIICAGTDDASICAAVNALIDCKGGLAAARNSDDVATMPLPVSGLMSLSNAYAAAATYTQLNDTAKELGTKMHAPFMTLSFMALLVIPALKLSDKGLFDGARFGFTSLEV